MTLKDLKVGQSAVIKSVGGEGALRQHFLDMGVIPSAKVTLVKFAPMGDPMELKIHGYELTLRLEDAKKIEVTLVDEKKAADEVQLTAEELKKALRDNLKLGVYTLVRKVSPMAAVKPFSPSSATAWYRASWVRLIAVHSTSPVWRLMVVPSLVA